MSTQTPLQPLFRIAPNDFSSVNGRTRCVICWAVKTTEKLTVATLTTFPRMCQWKQPDSEGHRVHDSKVGTFWKWPRDRKEQCDHSGLEVGPCLSAQRQPRELCGDSISCPASWLLRRRWWHPTLGPLPGKPHGRRSLVGCSPWAHQELDTMERLHFHFSLSRIGEGNGNPLQCSCLEDPRVGGAWWAAVYGVAQNWTWLKRLSSSSSYRCGGGYLDWSICQTQRLRHHNEWILL